MSHEKKKDPWLPPDLWFVSGIPIIIAGVAASLFFEVWRFFSLDWLWFLIGILVMVSGVVLVVKKEKIPRDWNSAGQWLILIGIVGIFFGLFWIPKPSREEKATVIRLEIIKNFGSEYVRDLKLLPPIENRELVKTVCRENSKVEVEFLRRGLNADGELLDGWGTPLRIVANVDESLTFISAGKDKKFGTKDDLSRTTPTLLALTVSSSSR